MSGMESEFITGHEILLSAPSFAYNVVLAMCETALVGSYSPHSNKYFF
jgi:hypothetical protein